MASKYGWARCSRFLVCLLVAWAVVPTGSAEAAESPRLMLILDASGSMWGRVDGEPKIVAARRVLTDLAGELPETSEVGLVAYGHRREGDCEDIELVLPMGPLDRDDLVDRVHGLNPKGKTPITEASRQALEAVGDHATILLVSDGLETCDGDPCALVKEARAARTDLTFHVIGFDVGDVDISQLTCMAKEGGGRYFGASDAEELAAALDQVVVESSGPTGGLRMGALVGEERIDALVVARDGSSGEDVARGRTYTQAETNPLELALPPGTYDIDVTSVDIDGAETQTFSGVVIEEGDMVEHTARFGKGTLVVGATGNGELEDTVVRVYRAGETSPTTQSRTYTSPDSNPKSFTLPPGSYEVEVESVDISGETTRRRPVEVQAGETVELTEDFPSATVGIRVTAGGTLADAVVAIYAPSGGSALAQGRTYTSENSNPKRFVVEPGTYRVTVKPIRGGTQQELTVEVEAGGEEIHEVEVGG